MEPGNALTATLERLPGVLAAAFLDVGRRPRVYLATTADADIDALRQTAVALLRDNGFDARPDHIHIGKTPTRALARIALPRATLDSLDVHRADNRVTCDVRLRVEARLSPGSASEPDTPGGRARAAATAALRAAERMDPDLRLGLEGIRRMDVFGHPGVSVLVEATAGRAHAHLPGIVLIERSIEESAALAVLEALRSWTAG